MSHGFYYKSHVLFYFCVMLLNMHHSILLRVVFILDVKTIQKIHKVNQFEFNDNLPCERGQLS